MVHLFEDGYFSTHEGQVFQLGFFNRFDGVHISRLLLAASVDHPVVALPEYFALVHVVPIAHVHAHPVGRLAGVRIARLDPAPPCLAQRQRTAVGVARPRGTVAPPRRFAAGRAALRFLRHVRRPPVHHVVFGRVVAGGGRGFAAAVGGGLRGVAPAGGGAVVALLRGGGVPPVHAPRVAPRFVGVRGRLLFDRRLPLFVRIRRGLGHVRITYFRADGRKLRRDAVIISHLIQSNEWGSQQGMYSILPQPPLFIFHTRYITASGSQTCPSVYLDPNMTTRKAKYDNPESKRDGSGVVAKSDQ
mmetsp:Transcript_39108/g.76273  ORF Transcript_39108/g.76273 Transcript_39108/m.76273 type:complete len:302 (-) Transcript_39108:57-962(-)